jgi:hypothetical protein
MPTPARAMKRNNTWRSGTRPRTPAIFDAGLQTLGRRHLLGRFWKSARGFWHGPTALLAWGLIALLIVITVLQLLVQYRLNLWNRDFFNALELRAGGEIWHQTHLLALFAALCIGLALARAIGLSGRVIDHQLHQLRDLLSSEIAGVLDEGSASAGYTKAVPLDDPLAPRRVTTMLPNPVVMMVGAPAPILKETPTGLWSMSTCGEKENCLAPM